MSHRTLLAVLVVAFVSIGIAALSLHAQPKDAPKPGVQFDAVVVMTKQGAASAVTLEKAQVRSVGGRQFVVGRESRETAITQPKFAGRTTWIPLDEVAQLVQLD